MSPREKHNRMKVKSSPLLLYTHLTQLKALTPSGVFTVCLEGIVAHWGKKILNFFYSAFLVAIFAEKSAT